MRLSGVPAEAQAICNAMGFELIEEIDSGSYKIVFRVRDAAQRDLALKIIFRGDSERIRRELEKARAIQHRSVAYCEHAGIHKTTSGEEVPFLLEEFLPGGSMEARAKVAIPSYEEVIMAGVELIDLLAALDKTRVVHRDIKPPNILFRDETWRYPVVTDFGLIRVLDDKSLTKSWRSSGPCTPYYASPEQLLNNAKLIDWRTDQFNLGVTMSEVYAGIHPYQEKLGPGSDLDTTVERVAQRKEHAPAIVEELHRIGLGCIITMTKPYPYQRYETPDDLSSAWPEGGLS